MNSETVYGVIDFSLSKHLNQEKLIDELFLPFAQNDFVVNVLSVGTSNQKIATIENYLKSAIKIFEIQKNDLLMILQNLQLKQMLQEAIENTSKEFNKIENFFDLLINHAILNNISDIHFESKNEFFSIRVRIDGILVVIMNLDEKYFGTISSYLKLISKLDISQKRIPQNGRFTKMIDGEQFDFRISCMPTINGESIVIRILSNQNIEINLKHLGFDPKTLQIIQNSIKSSSGLILVSGPTGSGKTTSLYAILKELNSTTKKILTIEDPVEYKIDNVQQVGVNPEIGLDFITILKNALRQDPDIMMIGEIRDEESLKIAIAAALTGHLVLATIHTNSAILTIDRMLDLNADPFLISSTIKAIISQRLVRRICQKCFGAGCVKCNMSGYFGREIVSEILTNSKNLAKSISIKSASDEIYQIAKAEGFSTMSENGMNKVEDKLIKLEDLLLATS